jgi:hypothetical protein
MAQITAFGVDVVEGAVNSPIRISFESAGVAVVTSGKTSSHEKSSKCPVTKSNDIIDPVTQAWSRSKP